MLERSGRRSTRSLRARSYLEWGTPIETPRTGCVAVLSRGADPVLGHVGFVIGETADGFVLLGGNQSNAVTVQVFARSRLLALRWPEEMTHDAPKQHAPESVKPPVGFAGDDAFESALAHVLKMEGGFSNDPYDPGGPTNFGITLKTYATYLGKTIDASSSAALTAALRSISPDVVKTIYRRRYWTPAQCADMPPGLDLFHFDAAVNHGVAGAMRILQEALGVAADGIPGPITRRAIMIATPEALIQRYAALRERRYRALPHFWRFGRGWLNRVAATKAAAFKRLAPVPISEARASNPTFPSTQGDDVMSDAAIPTTKWWGRSLTVWGAFVTAAAAILPTLGPLVGLDITSEAIRQLGSDAGTIVQAIAAFVGTLMTLYGRARATAPLVRREMSVKL
jgi:lysozyme family protein